MNIKGISSIFCFFVFINKLHLLRIITKSFKMKGLLYLFIHLTIFLFLPITSFSQMQDVEWKELPSPSVGPETISNDLSSLEITDDGNIYFFFYDENSSSLIIKQLNVQTNAWFGVFNETLTGINPHQLKTHRVNNKVYFVLTRQDFPHSMYAWVLEPNQVVTNLFLNQNTSMETNPGMDFVVDKNSNLMYFATRDLNSQLYVDVFDLNNTTYIGPSSLGYMSNGIPDLSIDYTNNELYIAGTNLSNEYRVHISPLSPSPSFVPLNSAGELTSGEFAGNALGFEVSLNDKLNGSPSIILNNGTSGAVTYRLGLPGSVYTDVQLEALPGLEGYVTAGNGENDYILAQFPSLNLLFVLEVLPDGTLMRVAENNNPILATMLSAGGAYALSKSPNHQRTAAFFHGPGNDGTAGGNFRLTNNAPLLINYSAEIGCANQTGVVVKNIVFQDLDGDNVFITNNFTSTNTGVINPASIQANQNVLGHWTIGANAIGTGSTDITFDYTDGLDTITETINIIVAQPQTGNFETTQIDLCNNKNIVDFDDYVDEPGGSYSVQGFQIEDGTFDLDSLSISTYPFTGSITYEFEDGNGCISADNSTFVVYEAPSANLSVTNTTCGDSLGEITANVQSPNGNYNSYWNTGDQNTLTTTGLSSGTYYLNIIDEAGCIHVAQGDVVASDFAVVGDVTDPSCFNSDDGAITLNVFGGSGNYSVLWSTGHSTPNLTDLTAGNYQVIVRDEDGCEATKNFNLQNPNKFIVNYLVSKPDCNQANGALELSNSFGGTTPYDFQWITDQGPETTQDLIGIEEGIYSVTVTDDNGCEATKTFQVNGNNAPMVSVERIRKSLCGMSNGKIDISVTPATGEQITGIEWSNGATTMDINSLMPGSYECLVTQSNGCEAIYEYNVGTARPLKPEICIVTVDSTTNTNLIVWEKNVLNPFDIEYYNIYRETSNAHEYKVIDTVHRSNISVFNDVVASPANRSWRYRISAVSSCGLESALSRSHKTIHLVTQEVAGEVDIVWDNYEGFPFGSYDLLRKTSTEPWEVIEPNIAFASLPFHSDTPPSFDGLDYMIEVYPPGGDCSATFGKAQDYNAARSNKPTSAFNPGDGTGDPNNSLSKEENENFTVALYPNPSNGLFEVAMSHTISSTILKMEVVDLNGKMIHQNEIQNGVNYINLQNIESGIYFVRLHDESESETFRIVIK